MKDRKQPIAWKASEQIGGSDWQRKWRSTERYKEAPRCDGSVMD